MRIYAFEGTRYTPRAGEPDLLAAPPFDQIGPELAAQLHAASPCQFAHLTRPVEGEEGDPHRHAAALHRSWLAEGQVGRDAAPCLYPYVIEGTDGTRRLGLGALVGVEPEGSGVIRPHEKTLDKPFAERLGLLRETRIDLEPVMFLADDGGELEALLGEDVEAAAPAAAHRDPAGFRHLLYRVTDPARIARYREALAGRSAAIADGHHRYKVARTFAEETGAPAGSAAGAKLAVLFSMRSPHLVIDPIHRGLAEAPDLGPLHGLLASRQTLEAADGQAVAAAVAAAPQPALAVRLGQASPELWQLDPARMPTGSPPGAETLAVCHLHSVLLPAAGLPPEAALDGTIAYRADPAALWRQVGEGALALGVWLPPMTAPAFGEAISRGDLLPAKATRFLPKLVSGLVWAGHDARVL